MGELDFGSGRFLDLIMIEVKYAFILSCVIMVPVALGISALDAYFICRLFFGLHYSMTAWSLVLVSFGLAPLASYPLPNLIC